MKVMTWMWIVIGIFVVIFLSSVVSLQGRATRSERDLAARQGELGKAKEELQKAENDLQKYEKPYDELLVLEDKEPRPKAACTMCCCSKTLKQCHVSCIRFKGGHNAMCSSLCAMKARGIPMPLEHGSVPEHRHQH